MVLDYYKRNYIGENMVFVATGNVEHDEIVDMVEGSFGKLDKGTELERLNEERPIYNPALLFIRDDEMVNSNVGVFYDAPSWKHKDYYGFLML